MYDKLYKYDYTSEIKYVKLYLYVITKGGIILNMDNKKWKKVGRVALILALAGVTTYLISKQMSKKNEKGSKEK